MKRFTYASLLVVLAALIIVVFPAFAQLGDTDVSSFTVQNISGSMASVVVDFYAEDGTKYTPPFLDAGNTIPNPFQLAAGASRQIYVPNIPAASLPPGRYSLVISSNVQVVAQAGVAGTGGTRFTGSYTGFSSGSPTTYLAGVNFNFFGWYSMITVQNLHSSPADVTVTITCSSGQTGTLSKTGVPAFSSFTWAMKNTTPSGFTSGTVCDGSAKITGKVAGTNDPANVVAVNNNNRPSNGNTNTFEAMPSGGSPLFVPSLSNNFHGWYSALTIVKLSSGNATVTVTYDDGDPNDTCNLTDAIPSCKLIMSVDHVKTGRFSATVSAPSGTQLIAIAGSSFGNWSGATAAVQGGSAEVAIPNVAKRYFGWISAINCQNVGSPSTSLNVTYSGYSGSAYNTKSLASGESIQILVFNESFLPNGWQGGATIKANNASAQVACTVGNSNPDSSATTPGDWTSQYNAYNK